MLNIIVLDIPVKILNIILPIFNQFRVHYMFWHLNIVNLNFFFNGLLLQKIHQMVCSLYQSHIINNMKFGRALHNFSTPYQRLFLVRLF